jgi:hypothetical protein
MKSFISKSGNASTIVIKLTVTYGEIMLIRYVVGREIMDQLTVTHDEGSVIYSAASRKLASGCWKRLAADNKHFTRLDK